MYDYIKDTIQSIHELRVVWTGRDGFQITDWEHMGSEFLETSKIEELRRKLRKKGYDIDAVGVSDEGGRLTLDINPIPKTRQKTHKTKYSRTGDNRGEYQGDAYSSAGQDNTDRARSKSNDKKTGGNNRRTQETHKEAAYLSKRERSMAIRLLGMMGSQNEQERATAGKKLDALRQQHEISWDMLIKEMNR